MNLANQICTKRMTIRSNAIVFVMLIGFFVSCYEPNGPTCPSEKDNFNATVQEYEFATCLQSAKGCDTFFAKSINSTGGDSLSLVGIGSNCPGTFNINVILNNIKSTGEYEFGVESVPGEPWAACTYHHHWDPYYFDATTDSVPGLWAPFGSGVVTIENLSSDHISGTFHATFPNTPANLEITSGSFSLSLTLN